MSLQPNVKPEEMEHLEKLEYAKFMIDMIDFPNAREKQRWSELAREIRHIEYGYAYAFNFGLNRSYFNIHTDDRKDSEINEVLAKMVEMGTLPNDCDFSITEKENYEIYIEVK